MSGYLQENRRAWDERASTSDLHALPVTPADLANPLRSLDPMGWFDGSIRGKNVLCLAAGGGRHGILCAAAGARVTVVDLSPKMLELDARLAAEHGFKIQLVCTSMENLGALNSTLFDLVLQPVSTCYVPDPSLCFAAVSAVSKPGSLYISQHKQPLAQQAQFSPTAGGYVIRSGLAKGKPLAPVQRESSLSHREGGTTEFAHSLETILSGICQAGFAIENLLEPQHADPASEPGSFAHRASHLPPFITVKARRNEVTVAKSTLLWSPPAKD